VCIKLNHSIFLKLRFNLYISLDEQLFLFDIFTCLLEYLGIIFRWLVIKKFINLNLLSLIKYLRLLSLKEGHILHFVLNQTVSFYFLIKVKVANYNALFFLFVLLGTVSSFVFVLLIILQVNFLNFYLLSIFK
jgi:hypothetical protein